MTTILPRIAEAEPTSWQAEGEAGFGALSTDRGPLPLAAIDVRMRVDGLLAAIQLTQTFLNTHDSHLEATYIFPLPDRFAVTRFQLEVAGRVIEGDLKERGQARQEYREAIQAGQRAAITEEERPGVFSLRVGNLPPGETAVVRLALAGPLAYRAGEVELRFPLVVAPRYIPGTPLPGPAVGKGTEPDTDAVPDASRISPPVLLPGFPSPVRLGLSVELLTATLCPHEVRSSLHTVVEDETATCRRLRLEPGERLDRDFILRYRLAEDEVRTALTLQPDEKGNEGTFLLTLVPPRLGGGTERPRDLVFVLDRSGSMVGWKMVAARRAVARMVETLQEADRFTVLAFDNAVEAPRGFDAEELVPATARRRFQAEDFVTRVEARGGTEMAEPLRRAVGLLTTGEPAAGRERILVLITDGQVGNEDQVLREIGPGARAIRIFTLGIDKAVNAAFLRRLSDLGGGASEVIESEERLQEVMERIHRQIGTPVLTELRLEEAGLGVHPPSITPARLPDLFDGSPVMILGRFRGKPEGGVTLRGKDPSGRPLALQAVGLREEGLPLASVWARARVRDLEDRYVIERSPALEKEILALSLGHKVLCRFTAYVAVDREEVINPGGQVHSLVQPVEQPRGWAQPMKKNERLDACVRASAPPRPAASAAPPMPTKGGTAREEQLFRARSRSADDISAVPPPEAPPSGEKESLLGRLFGGLRRSLKRQPPAATRAGGGPRTFEDVLRLLEQAGGKGDAERMALLRQVLPVLKALVEERVREGESSAVLTELGNAIRQAEQTLVSAIQDGRVPVLDVVRLRLALHAYLRGQAGSPGTGEAREGFWK